MPDDENNLLYFNGIDISSGDYALPPMSRAHFNQAVLGQGKLAEQDAADYYEDYQKEGEGEEHLTLGDDRDPDDLADAGWGVIFSKDEDPKVIEALQPLMAHRRKMAGDYYYEYVGAKAVDDHHRQGYYEGETKEQFLERRGAESYGPALPEFAPYYLLIVGNPDQIPFEFQYQLDQQYAVGRIHFNTPDEYARYAANVVTAETSKTALPRRALFFGPDHDKATKISAEHLVEELMKQLPGRLKLGWQLESALREEATKEALAGALNGDEAPTLLFTASHGAVVPAGQGNQADFQGALICQDYKHRGDKNLLPEQYHFSADDVTSGSQLLGRIAFHFACFSAGTPKRNDFRLSSELLDSLPLSDSRRKTFSQEQLAKSSFVARLPKQLLLSGALAVVGHVDRAWGASIYYSSRARRAGAHLGTYRTTMKRIMEGQRIGYAMEKFDERYGEYSAAITQEQKNRGNFMPEKEDSEMVDLWTANQDARNYIIIGDPAAHLTVTEA